VNPKWGTKSLGDICDFQGGSQPPKSEFVYQEEPKHVRFLQIRDFGSDKNVTYIPVSEKNRTCEEGDILIGRYGASVGKILTGKAGAYNVALVKTIPNPKVVERSWFYNYLISDEFQERLRNVAERSAQNGFSKEDIFGFPVPVPPLPEQRRIVGILDETFDGIATAKANAEKNLQNARALFESHLQSVFTRCDKDWMRDKLLNLTTKIGSGATPRGGEAAYISKGISLVRSLNVYDLGFRYRNLAFLDDNQADDLSNVELRQRDVLLNITGASVARCCIVPTDILPARVNQHVSIIRPISEKLDAGFLHYLLISKPYKDQLLQTGAEGGSTRQAITKAQIQDFDVEYPEDIRQQKSIAARLDSILNETQRLDSIYQQKLAALEALKKSLLHQALSGQL
jgi:type I restriction enzyme S subunit